MRPKRRIAELIRICQKEESDEKIASAIVELEELKADEATATLLILLTHSSELVRANAASALGVFGTKGAPVERGLTVALTDSRSLVRLLAAEALGMLGAKGALDALAQRLTSDPDVMVRVHAAEALGELRDPSANPVLIQALEDPDSTVRAYVAEALPLVLGAPDRTEGAIREQLNRESEDFARIFLLAALYVLGDTASLTALLGRVQGMDETNAVVALYKAVEIAERPDRDIVVRALDDLGDSRPELSHEYDALRRKLSNSLP